jgi:hypothetical protein
LAANTRAWVAIEVSPEQSSASPIMKLNSGKPKARSVT